MLCLQFCEDDWIQDRVSLLIKLDRHAHSLREAGRNSKCIHTSVVSNSVFSLRAHFQRGVIEPAQVRVLVKIRADVQAAAQHDQRLRAADSDPLRKAKSKESPNAQRAGLSCYLWVQSEVVGDVLDGEIGALAPQLDRVSALYELRQIVYLRRIRDNDDCVNTRFFLVVLVIGNAIPDASAG
eukprot:6203798-Pleurochrysis_carterae.AAC.2